MLPISIAVLSLLAPPSLPSSDEAAASPQTLELLDVFEIEHATDPQISPDGEHVVYVRNAMDAMKDRRTSALWIASVAGDDHRPLTMDAGGEAASTSSPRWSPDGTRLAYVSSSSGSAQIHVRWMDTGQEARLTHLPSGPSGLAWSPNGRWLAFTMFVEDRSKPFVTPPKKPKGAQWADPPKVITSMHYRADGRGYLKEGHRQLFVLRADGGTPRQVTRGNFDVERQLSWTPDGRSIVIASNRRDDIESEPADTELYEVTVVDGSMRALTDRYGPDENPAVSPDGRAVAYVGFDDTHQGYRVRKLYVVDREGGEPTLLTGPLDRSVRSVHWSPDGSGILFLYDSEGVTTLAVATLGGRTQALAEDLGGESLGRPYAGGAYSVADNGRIAYTTTRPQRPSDVAVLSPNGELRPLTALNDDALGHKHLGRVEELWCESPTDGRKIQGWIVRPPDFDASKTYPLILEIHGGPFANYGPRFSAECQLYAAAGYVVLYVNPRGSTSYGEEFGNLIHHAYPGDDYHDLMAAVDATIAKGSIDEDALFVTGGSGGGVLSAWIVGKTDRFRAAVVAKPVIHWTSFVLTADMYDVFTKYWFPGYPWDFPEHYWERSPLSLVGNVTTPTMLLTGEADYRTPMSESEQYYQALKLRGVDTALVRVPDASHGIARRPSHLIAKVAHVLEWFERHAPSAESDEER